METYKKIIDNREIEYADVIHHTTRTKFSFWERVRILLGKEAVINSEIYTKAECHVVYSEAKSSVVPFIVRKIVGGVATLPNPQSDREAIASDWKAIGNDLKSVME